MSKREEPWRLRARKAFEVVFGPKQRIFLATCAALIFLAILVTPILIPRPESGSMSDESPNTAGPFGAPSSAPCEPEGGEAPGPLMGTLRQGEYQFTHISNVDKAYPWLFSHLIRNEHSRKLLSVQWAKAGIRFDGITVGGCGRNDVSTYMNWQIDLDAPVEYGAEAEFQKTASVYTQNRFPEPEEGTIAIPKLDSRLFVTLEDRTVDFRFLSYLEGGLVHYGVQNVGSRDILFTIPVLTSRFESKNVVSQWESFAERRNIFFLGVSEDPRFEEFQVFLPEVKGYAEELVAVKIFAKENPEQAVALGRVSLYLPVF